MKSLATHNGKFHADDVFAVAILKLIYPKVKIIRTRNSKDLEKADARIDVGGKYDHKTLDYDHHQKDFKETRKNKIPYASAGLIWKHHGEKLNNSKEIWQTIEDKIITYIDAGDNGVKTYTSKETEPYAISDIIESFNPEWPNKTEKNFNERFDEAVHIATKILKNEIELAESKIEAAKTIKKKISETNKEYLILEENMPYQDAVRNNSKKIKYVLKKDPVDHIWAILAIRKEKTGFEVRKDLPKSWAGLSDEALVKVTGVKDAKFCHKKLFIAIAKSKEGAIKLAELALKNDR